MATPNFGWTLPTVGGSNNAWGTLANTVFTAIDTDLEAVKVTADAAAAAIATLAALAAALQGQQTLYVSAEILQPNNDEDDIIYGQASGARLEGDQSKTMFGALPPLPVGAVLDEVHLYCDKGGNTSVTVTVMAVDLSGTVTTLGSGTRSSSGVGAASAVALAHTIGAKFLKVKTAQIGAFNPFFYGLKILYTPAA